jgi:hypothetical protein
MAAEIIYSVFVSSTFDDLREERGEIQKALLKSKCFPIGMELFPSSDDDTWDFIQRQIDQADYYIVVIAGRYGSIGRDGVSFTEMKYDYARSIGKPTLAFIHAAPGTIPAERTEMDSQARERLNAFKKKAQQSIVNYYRTPHELAMQVMASLVDLKDRKPAIGFIRSDQTVDAKRYADLLEENHRLKEMVSKFEATNAPFAGSDEAIVFDDANVVGGGHISATLTFDRIFIAVAESIIDARCADAEIGCVILNEIASDKIEYLRMHGCFISEATLAYIRRKLFSAGLIELHPTTSEEQMFGRTIASITYNIWALTSFGRTQYGLLSRVAGEG